MKNNMNVILVNVGLPKTGTSFLGNILKQSDGLSVSTIKEPTYLVERSNKNKNKIMRRVLADGNSHRPLSWYLELFDQQKRIGVDLSTQYWMRKEELTDVKVDQKRFIIYRDPKDQIISYYKHLRRGYLPEKPLADIVRCNPEFGMYMKSMYEFGVLSGSIEDEDIKVFEFSSLVNDPEAFFKSFTEWAGIEKNSQKIRFDVEQNVAGTPRNKFFNNLLMSEYLKKIKFIIPECFYNRAVLIRKKLIRNNLTQSNIVDIPYYSIDVEFLIDYVSED